MKNEDILALSEHALIDHVHHELRQHSTAARGFTQLLANGELGFASEKQREILLMLQSNIEKIAEINRWLELWRSQFASE